MKSLLLAALLLASAPLRAAVVVAEAPAAADWHKAQLTEAMGDALKGAGYRLQDDGQVLDPLTHLPLTADQLAAALTQMNLNTQRLALERLNVLLSKNPPDVAGAKALRDSVPDEVARALDANKGAAALRALSDQSLEKIAAYFDAARTPEERRLAAQPVLAGAPGPRVPLPYFTPAEKALGDALRGASNRALAADPYGRKILGRLNGKDGKPDLPPIVVEDPSGAAAEYDYRRGALIVDRQALLSAAADGVPAKDRAALARTLSSRTALIDYLNAHPEVLKTFAERNDVVLAHELTHAWQERRDPVLREMARGTLPQAVLLDYELEAWTTKNLYIDSRLKHAPGAAIDPFELQDYQRMAADRAAWARRLRANYEGSAINALDLESTTQIQGRRLEAARRRAVSTREQQEAKALDLAAMTRAERELSAASKAERARLARLDAASAKAAAGSAKTLAEHYLAAALDASSDVDRAVFLQKAETFATAAGDAPLLEKVRSMKGRSR